MLISPRDEARLESVGGRRGIFGADEVVAVAVAEADEEDDSSSFWDNLQEEEVEEERQPRTPHDPGRPTKEEERRHMLHHWPFRAWCRHCVRGRAIGSPHRAKTDDDREFGRSRVPTLSMDHCFLGTAADDESAHVNPFLILYDNDTEAIYAVAVPDKSVRQWIVEYMFMIINELGYEGVKIAMKMMELQS